MGSGKSTIGKALAREWGYTFIDLDNYIEEKYRLKIPGIFDKYGEQGFRKLEGQALAEVINKNSKAIISLGGGTPCFENNMDLIKSITQSIYLKISPSELTKRLSRSANPRPLVQNKNSEELKEYVTLELQKREVFYQQADHVIESDCIQIQDLLTFLTRPE